MAGGLPRSTVFVEGTRFRKRPVDLTPFAERPRPAVQRNPYYKFGHGPFAHLPEQLRQRALLRLEQRLDYWEHKTGERPRPGTVRFMYICGGVVKQLKQPLTRDEAAALGRRRKAIKQMARQLARGTWRLNRGGVSHRFIAKERRSQGPRVAQTIGPVAAAPFRPMLAERSANVLGEL